MQKAFMLRTIRRGSFFAVYEREYCSESSVLNLHFIHPFLWKAFFTPEMILINPDKKRPSFLFFTTFIRRGVEKCDLDSFLFSFFIWRKHCSSSQGGEWVNEAAKKEKFFSCHTVWMDDEHTDTPTTTFGSVAKSQLLLLLPSQRPFSLKLFLFLSLFRSVSSSTCVASTGRNIPHLRESFGTTKRQNLFG